MGRVAVVGSLNCDLVMRVARRPARGETVLAQSFHTFVGGKGGNQAIACARAGAEVSMIGRVGEDPFGAAVLQKLEASGIDCHFVGKDAERGTGIADIVVDDAGDNAICVAPRANEGLDASHVEAARERITHADVVLVQLEIPLEAALAAAELGRAAGAIVVLNPAPAPAPSALWSEVAATVDLIVPNQSEVETITGIAAQSRDRTVQALRALRGLGIPTPLVTMGERGVMWLDEHDEPRLATSFPVSVVDTTAAGDAFCGALAAALSEKTPMERAIVAGCAAGALACTKLGAEPSLPTREAIECLVASRHS